MFNMAQIEAGKTLNQTATEASVRFNMHALREELLWQVHDKIQKIAREECVKIG